MRADANNPNERQAVAKGKSRSSKTLRVQCGKDGEGRGRCMRINCAQSDVRAFGIALGWKATALEAGVWVESATEGGRIFMAAWRKLEEGGPARHRQEKKVERVQKRCFRRRDNRRIREAIQTGLVDESKGSCTGTRQTETLVATRQHDVDTPRGALLVISYFCSVCCSRLVFFYYSTTMVINILIYQHSFLVNL